MINEEYIVLADGHGKPLRRISWIELKITDHPYSDFRPTQVEGEFYQRPLGSDLYPINEWYNLARKYELRAMQRSTRKSFVRKGTMDVNALEVFTNDEDMAVIELDIQRGVPISDGIEVFSPPPLSADIYRNSAMIAADFAEVAGMTDEARGRATADTATQVNTMEKYSGSRISHDRKILAETWRRAFKKLNDYIDANMTKERAVMVQGTDGETFQALVDLDMIAGDFDVEVDFQEMAQADTAMQATGRAQILQAIGQAPGMFTSDILVRGWLEPFGVKDENFIGAVAEAAQAMVAAIAQQAQPQGEGQVPEAGAPQNEADAISQTAAGQQPLRMSSAT